MDDAFPTNRTVAPLAAQGIRRRGGKLDNGHADVVEYIPGIPRRRRFCFPWRQLERAEDVAIVGLAIDVVSTS